MFYALYKARGRSLHVVPRLSLQTAGDTVGIAGGPLGDHQGSTHSGEVIASNKDHASVRESVDQL